MAIDVNDPKILAWAVDNGFDPDDTDLMLTAYFDWLSIIANLLDRDTFKLYMELPLGRMRGTGLWVYEYAQDSLPPGII